MAGWLIGRSAVDDTSLLFPKHERLGGAARRHAPGRSIFDKIHGETNTT
jgi:hypothetical protein